MEDRPARHPKPVPDRRPVAPRFRPVPALVLAVLPLLAYILLDEGGIAMRGRWPPLVVTLAEMSSDFVKLVPLLCAVALVTGVALVLQSVPVAQKGFYAAASLLAASAFTHAVKPLVGRARPTVFDDAGLFGRRMFDGSFDYISFPSGHATHAAALFAALAFAFPAGRLPFLALALWFALTRVVLGVHYPSDVAAGLLVGLVVAILVARLAARFGLVFRRPE